MSLTPGAETSPLANRDVPDQPALVSRLQTANLRLRAERAGLGLPTSPTPGDAVFANDFLAHGLTPRTAAAAERTLNLGTRWLENNSGGISNVSDETKMWVGAFLVIGAIGLLTGAFKDRPESQASIDRAAAERSRADAERLRAEATANTAALGGRGPNGGPAGGPGENRAGFEKADADNLQDTLRDSAVVFLGGEANREKADNGITVATAPDGSMTVTVTDKLLNELNDTPFRYLRLTYQRESRAGQTVWTMKFDGRDARQNLNTLTNSVRTGRDLRRAEITYASAGNRIADTITAVRNENGTYTAVMKPFTAEQMLGRAAELESLLIARVVASYPEFEMPAGRAPGTPIRVPGLTIDVVRQILDGDRYKKMDA